MDASFMNAPEYDFLRTDPRLGKRIVLLALGGSRAYGTNRPDSDYDVRGCAMPLQDDLYLHNENYESFVEPITDTTVYTLHKLFEMLLECNPSSMEILGFQDKSEFLYLDPVGEKIWQNRHLFYSQHAQFSFGRYADKQLTRLINAMRRNSPTQEEKDRQIVRSVENAMFTFNERYKCFDNGSILVYQDKAGEMRIDMRYLGAPLREMNGMMQEISSIVRKSDKINHRNRKRDDFHLDKHAMHLVRLYLAAIDFAKTCEFYTNMDRHLDVLLPILHGEHREEDGSLKPWFIQLTDHLHAEMMDAFEHTKLPEKADLEAIKSLELELLHDYLR